MTFTVKVRGSSSQPIAAEYQCPVHGRFTLDVRRDANGDPPVEVWCPQREPCDRFCDRCDVGADHENLCGRSSPYVISGPRVRVNPVEAVRGKWQKPERPTWTDTTNLGEGQDLDEWRAERAKVWERHDEQENRELFG